ncbi:hypothetical protein F5X98DRAFT_344339 [Xylaria grammica]|nr:hypothetical protein F5X98DRAFT_344339 [Xylaria grammica]
MAPRKRARPDASNKNGKDSLPSTPLSQSTEVASLLPNDLSSPSVQLKKPDHSNSSDTAASYNAKRVRKTNSWYGVSKSSPSIQVARENIMGDTRRSEAAVDFSRFGKNKSDTPTDHDSQSVGTLRTIAETTAEAQQDELASFVKHPESINANDVIENTATTSALVSPTTENVLRMPTKPSSLFSWLNRSAVQGQSELANNNTETYQTTLETTESIQRQDAEAELPLEAPEPKKQTSSWFGVWSSSAIPTAQETVQEGLANEDTIGREPKTKENEDLMQDAPTLSAPVPTTAKPSAWAFWSRGSAPQKAGENASSTEQGEFAVMGDGSEACPRRSSVEINEENGNKRDLPIKFSLERLPKGARATTTKKGPPPSMDIDGPFTAHPSTSNRKISQLNSSKSATTLTHKASPPNLLLPSFKGTYCTKENPSIIKQIAQFLLRTQQPPTNHVFLSKDPPTIKKAIAIGVHGLFPAPYLRPMIGQPTGTSIRFSRLCAEAIHRWTESNGSVDCEIEKVALEGEGKIADRVNNLWRLLLNWIEHIKNADLIMLACHSQGVPVGIMLLAKLIDLGVITNSRVGVCAMAGVNLGPFSDYKSGMGILMESAAELWQFSDQGSEVSKRYEQALKTVVDYGARITYIGSIDDQLVPLVSALHGPVSHPYIFRAVFIDGRNHAPDFLAHLIGFVLKLRNLGISDSGLIRELSVPLAGSLYSGEGHSRLYNDDQVYDLAVTHTLETTSVSGIPCEIQKYEGITNPNPYVLPWIMRGLLEEEFVKRNFEETAELLKQFDDWTPTTKALKDVKYRLEAIRSRL